MILPGREPKQLFHRPYRIRFFGSDERSRRQGLQCVKVNQAYTSKMSFNLFGKKKDSFDDKAANLVLIAKTAACTYYIPCANKFPLVFKIKSRHWDPILTVAICALATMRVQATAISDNRKIELVELIMKNLEEDQPTSLGAINHCLAFVNRSIEDGLFNSADHKRNPALVCTDALGAWSVAKLMGRFPESAEELGLMRAIGNLVLGNFSQYWD